MSSANSTLIAQYFEIREVGKTIKRYDTHFSEIHIEFDTL